MDVAFVCDEPYAVGLAAALESLKATESLQRVWVLNTGLQPDTLELLKQVPYPCPLASSPRVQFVSLGWACAASTHGTLYIYNSSDLSSQIRHSPRLLRRTSPCHGHHYAFPLHAGASYTSC